MWVSPEQYLEANPGITEGMMRAWLLARQSNGLTAVVKRPMGSRRLLIHRERMDNWIDREGKAS